MVERSRGVAANMSKGVQFLLKKNKIDVIQGFGKLAGNGKVEVTGEDGTKLYEADHIILQLAHVRNNFQIFRKMVSKLLDTAKL